mgnify:CR=1 FL=1
MTLHITPIEGGSALSDFRVQQLLPGLQAVHDRINGIAARYVHLVATTAPLQDAQKQTLSALLTYGEPYAGPVDGPVIVVSPRIGTVSPWASKATDIAHNCGFEVRRIERLTEYRLTLKSGLLGSAPLHAAHWAHVAALLHDIGEMELRQQLLGTLGDSRAVPQRLPPAGTFAAVLCDHHRQRL